MAIRTNAKKQETETSTAVVVPMIRVNKGNSELLSAIDKAIKGAKSVVQSITEVEPLIAKAANLSLTHALNTGDIMPADRLVKGLIALNHPSSTAMARELVTWFKLNSPIRWEKFGLGKPSLLKEGQEGFKPFDEAAAQETAFNETAQAKRARGAAQAAHKNTLAAADLKMMVGRTKGVVNWLNSMISGKDERKVNPAELTKMKRMATAINGVLKDFGGETAVVNIVKEEDSKKKAA